MAIDAAAALREGVRFDGAGAGLFAPDRADEAMALYDELRRTEPVFELGDGHWIVTRYEDARAMLRDPRFSNNREVRLTMRPEAALEPQPDQYMLFQDPPHHTRLRGLVQKAFLPQRIRALEPDIAALVDRLLDKVAADGEMDLIADLARPLPVAVIGVMLDVPPSDSAMIRDLAQESSLLLDSDFLPEADMERAVAGSAGLRTYFADLIEARRVAPGGDILSGLIAAEESGDMLSTEEIVTMADLLFVAGHETTVNLIGNGTRTMMEHEGTLERMAADPSLIPSAVEEAMRYSPSVAFNGRYTTADLDVGGTTVPFGAEIWVPTDAVNRDPARFPDPHRFDIARGDNAHLTFSIGPHVCLGAALARLEARIAWERLLARFRNIRPAGPTRWREHVTLRGLESLPVTFETIA